MHCLQKRIVKEQEKDRRVLAQATQNAKKYGWLTLSQSIALLEMYKRMRGEV